MLWWNSGENRWNQFFVVFFGGVAAGFCLAGESYLRGQWFRQALTMYVRALDCDQHCNEAKGLFANNLGKIALRFGSDLVVATSAQPQA